MPKLRQSAGSYMMSRSIVSRTAGAILGLCLCGAGTAWAGGGGADLVSLQNLLENTDGQSELCQIFSINPCPVPPTVTQTALELSALGNNLFEMLLTQNNIVPKGSRVYAANPAQDPPSSTQPLPGCVATLTLSSITTPSVQDCLSTLTPLAFISKNPPTTISIAQNPLAGTAQPTPLYDRTADAYLYAVAMSSAQAPGSHGLSNPDTVFFFYDTLFRTNQNNIITAQFRFPLSVLSSSDGTERVVPTTLNFTGTSGGDCSMSSVVGDFKGSGMPQQLPASKIGINCTVVFSASPASAQQHAIFEVAVPLLVTTACFTSGGCLDQLYFYTNQNQGVPNPVNSPLSVGTQTAGQGVYTAFVSSTNSGKGYGFAAGADVLGSGVAIGLAPNAGGSLAPPISGGTRFSLALCASLPVNTNGTGAQLRPAVGAFYAMATSGEMLLAAPLPSAFKAGGSPPFCP